MPQNGDFLKRGVKLLNTAAETFIIYLLIIFCFYELPIHRYLS